MTENRVLFDYDRAARTSVPEAVFCQSKSREIIYSLMKEFSQADAPAILFTRLSEEVFSSCPAEVSRHYCFDSLARTAFCKNSIRNTKAVWPSSQPERQTASSPGKPRVRWNS